MDKKLKKAYKRPMPKHYFIDPGNLCNLSCPFCPTGRRTDNAQRGLMSRETFDIIFDKIRKHAKLICLYNWGEPFINRDILYMLSVCAKHHIHSHIDSNLTLRDFSDDEAEAIVRSGVSSIFASIDGITQETYEKYRVNGKLDRALNNLRQIMNAKKQLNMKTPELAWAFYIHKFNEHEVFRAKELADEIGINIWFKLLSADPSWQSSFHQEWNEILAFPKWVEAAYPVPHDPQSAELHFHKAILEVCKQPFDTMIVEWNGDVMPCCAVSGDEYKMGNLIEDSLDAVWNGERLCRCRQFIKNYGPVQNTGAVCETLICPLKQKYDDQFIGTASENISEAKSWKALFSRHKIFKRKGKIMQ